MSEKKLTIADIANDLGLSKSTVSRALSGKGRISPETRALVQGYAKKRNYKPSLPAKRKEKSRTLTIGVIMPQNYSIRHAPFFMKCLSGIHEAAAMQGYDILLTLSSNTDTKGLERMIFSHKADGVILMRSFLEDKAILLLEESGMPFVVIGSTDDDTAVRVDQDNEGAARELTSLLLREGSKQIALIGGDESYVVSRQRRNGFVEAHKAMKAFMNMDLLFMNRENIVSIEQAVETALFRKADCIIAMDDYICLTVMDYLKKRGVLVPAEVQVASFFNSHLLDGCTPGITAAAFGNRRLGITAGDTLLNIINKKPYRRITRLGYEIIFKGSTRELC